MVLALGSVSFFAFSKQGFCNYYYFTIGMLCLAVAASNVAANDFAAVVAALRAEAGYANVHSTANPGGQIRGQVLFSRADSIKDN